ncbi:splicing factor 45 isoform X2 [Drosophila sechellia]|uniref:splicing factor 45 isoform X2 n=1 Tax=Drosophila sechellia TaxID=7238 RepID=UPI0013DE0D29|nr:splicing factor 45 isoform X2 [Drosophila sechellia]
MVFGNKNVADPVGIKNGCQKAKPEVTCFAPITTVLSKPLISGKALPSILESINSGGWDVTDEYDPQWPNEYEKLKEKSNGSDNIRAGVSDREDREDKEKDRKRGRVGRREVYREEVSGQNLKLSGFGQRQNNADTYLPSPGPVAKQGGATIAPPPSLQEISIDSGCEATNTMPYSASSVAAKIMAKYGFKDGQGLGKSEQGMAMALQVEKTSKRGGRIIHEKDVFLPPLALSPPAICSQIGTSPSHKAMPPPQMVGTASESGDSITEIMKSPSKVVLLRNMVGPGDVDEELEPEVKDECNTKYGEVNSVIIHESFGTVPEDAVKIFVEFRRIESAIKAVVDLNGRFFGGRQVRAGFYNYDKFKCFQLY